MTEEEKAAAQKYWEENIEATLKENGGVIPFKYKIALGPNSLQEYRGLTDEQIKYLEDNDICNETWYEWTKTPRRNFENQQQTQQQTTQQEGENQGVTQQQNMYTDPETGETYAVGVDNETGNNIIYYDGEWLTEEQFNAMKERKKLPDGEKEEFDWNYVNKWVENNIEEFVNDYSFLTDANLYKKLEIVAHEESVPDVYKVAYATSLLNRILESPCPEGDDLIQFVEGTYTNNSTILMSVYFDLVYSIRICNKLKFPLKAISHFTKDGINYSEFLQNFQYYFTHEVYQDYSAINQTNEQFIINLSNYIKDFNPYSNPAQRKSLTDSVDTFYNLQGKNGSTYKEIFESWVFEDIKKCVHGPDYTTFSSLITALYQMNDAALKEVGDTEKKQKQEDYKKKTAGDNGEVSRLQEELEARENANISDIAEKNPEFVKQVRIETTKQYLEKFYKPMMDKKKISDEMIKKWVEEYPRASDRFACIDKLFGDEMFAMISDKDVEELKKLAFEYMEYLGVEFDEDYIEEFAINHLRGQSSLEDAKKNLKEEFKFQKKIFKKPIEELIIQKYQLEHQNELPSQQYINSEFETLEKSEGNYAYMMEILKQSIDKTQTTANLWKERVASILGNAFGGIKNFEDIYSELSKKTELYYARKFKSSEISSAIEKTENSLYQILQICNKWDKTDNIIYMYTHLEFDGYVEMGLKNEVFDIDNVFKYIIDISNAIFELGEYKPTFYSKNQESKFQGLGFEQYYEALKAELKKFSDNKEALKKEGEFDSLTIRQNIDTLFTTENDLAGHCYSIKECKQYEKAKQNCLNFYGAAKLAPEHRKEFEDNYDVIQGTSGQKIEELINLYQYNLESEGGQKLFYVEVEKYTKLIKDIYNAEESTDLPTSIQQMIEKLNRNEDNRILQLLPKYLYIESVYADYKDEKENIVRHFQYWLRYENRFNTFADVIFAEADDNYTYDNLNKILGKYTNIYHNRKKHRDIIYNWLNHDDMLPIRTKYQIVKGIDLNADDLERANPNLDIKKMLEKIKSEVDNGEKGIEHERLLKEGIIIWNKQIPNSFLTEANLLNHYKHAVYARRALETWLKYPTQITDYMKYNDLKNFNLIEFIQKNGGGSEKASKKEEMHDNYDFYNALAKLIDSNAKDLDLFNGCFNISSVVEYFKKYAEVSEITNKEEEKLKIFVKSNKDPEKIEYGVFLAYYLGYIRKNVPELQITPLNWETWSKVEINDKFIKYYNTVKEGFENLEWYQKSDQVKFMEEIIKKYEKESGEKIFIDVQNKIKSPEEILKLQVNPVLLKYYTLKTGELYKASSQDAQAIYQDLHDKIVKIDKSLKDIGDNTEIEKFFVDNKQTLIKNGFDYKTYIAQGKTIQQAYNHAQVIVCENEYMTKFETKGVPNSEYQALKTDEEKYQWLRKEINKYDKNFNAFNNDEFRKIYKNAHPVEIDVNDSVMKEVALKYDFDIDKAIEDFEYDGALIEFNKVWKRNYPYVLSQNASKKAATVKINEYIRFGKTFAKDELEEEIKQNVKDIHKSYDIFDLAEKYQGDIDTCILDLKFTRLVTLINNKFNQNFSNLEKTDKSIKWLEDYYTNEVNKSKSIQDLAPECKKYSDKFTDKITWQDLARNHNNQYTRAYNWIYSQLYSAELMETYKYTNEEVAAIITNNQGEKDDMKNNYGKLYSALKNEVDRVSKEYEEFTNDANVRNYLEKYNKSLKSKRFELKDIFLMKNSGHTKIGAEHFLLVEVFKITAGKKSSDSEIISKYSEANEQTNTMLKDEIEKYLDFYKRFSEDTTLKEYIKLDESRKSQPFDTVIKDLVFKFNSEDDSLEALEKAKRFLYNERNSAKYENYLRKTGKQNDGFQNMSDIDKQKFLKQQEEERKLLKKKFTSQDIKKLLKERDNYDNPNLYWKSDGVIDWKRLARDFNQDADKAKQGLELYNLQHQYRKAFKENFVFREGNTQDSDKYAEIKNFMEWYEDYKGDTQILSIIDKFNEGVEQDKKISLKDVIKAYKSDIKTAKVEIEYMTYERKMKKLNSNYDASKYKKNKESIRQMEQDYKLLKKSRQKFDENKLTKLLLDYSNRYEEMTENQLSDKYQRNYDLALNWLTIYDIIYRFNEYAQTVILNKQEYDMKYENNKELKESQRLLREVEKQFSDYVFQWEYLNSLPGLSEVFKYYKQKNPQASLKNLFNTNQYNAEKTFRVMLITYFNYIYSGSKDQIPEEEITKQLTEEEMKFDRERLWEKIKKGQENKNKLMKNLELQAQLNKTSLTETQKNELFSRYENSKDIINVVRIQEEVDKYNKNRKQEDQIPNNGLDKLKEFYIKGYTAEDLIKYFEALNKYNQNDFLDAHNEYKDKGGNLSQENVLEKNKNTFFDGIAFCKLQPLLERVGTLTNKKYDLERVLHDEGYNIDDIYKKYSQMETYYRFKKEYPKDDLVSKKYKTFEDLKSKNEEKINNVIEQMNKQIESIDAIRKTNMTGDLAEFNQSREEDKQLTAEDIYRLGVSQEDTKIIMRILDNLEEYNKASGGKITKENVNQLCNNPQKPNWITAYQKVILIPKLNLYNELAKKIKKHHKNLTDIIDKYKLNKSKNQNCDSIDEAAIKFEESLKELKSNYLKPYYDAYIEATGNTDFTLDNILTSYPDVLDAEKYLRYNKYIEQINKSNEELRTRYKTTKPLIDLKFDDFMKENDIPKTELLLSQKLQAINKMVKDESDKEVKENERKRIIRGKLSSLNRLRVLNGLPEYNLERYKDMSVEEASSQIEDDINIMKSKEQEKKQNQIQTGATSPGVPMRLLGNPNANKPDENKSEENKESTLFKDPKNSLLNNYKGGVMNIVERNEKGLSLRSLWLEKQRQAGNYPPLVPKEERTGPLNIKTYTPGQKPSSINSTTKDDDDSDFGSSDDDEEECMSKSFTNI